MQSPSQNHRPALTDRDALIAHRRRADRHGAELFLHRLAAAEIEDRLAEVNRTFTDVAIVTGFPEIWREFWPDARIVADDEVLDLPAAGCDLVIHGLALHWAEDVVGQIAQCARALRPDGLFIGVLFGGQTLSELRVVLAEAEARVTGGLSPRILPMGEIRDLGGLLSRAGLALPVADAVPQTVSYRDLFHLVRDLRGMGETNAMAARLRRPSRRDIFADAAGRYATEFPDHDDPSRIRATFDLIFLTGWAPSDNQPKPLRPGSAAMRLEDALNQVRKEQ